MQTYMIEWCGKGVSKAGSLDFSAKQATVEKAQRRKVDAVRVAVFMRDQNREPSPTRKMAFII